MANILRLKVSFFHFSSGSDLVCTLFPCVKWCYRFRPMQNISRKSASSILVSFICFICKVRRFGPAGWSTKACPFWMFWTVLPYEIITMKRRTVPIWSHPVACISKFKPQSDLLAVRICNSNAETITANPQGSREWTLLARKTKYVAILLNRRASVRVTTSSNGLVYMSRRPNSMRNRMFLSDLVIWSALKPVHKITHVTDFSKEPTILPERMLVGVTTHLLRISD